MNAAALLKTPTKSPLSRTPIDVPTLQGHEGDLAALLVLPGAPDLDVQRAALDALVLSVVQRPSMLRAVDLRRARALLVREIEIARGGPAHLMPVYLHLATASGDAATAATCVEEVARAMRRAGATAVVPQVVSSIAGPHRRRATRPARLRPAGTRTRRRSSWLGLLVGAGSLVAALAALAL